MRRAMILLACFLAACRAVPVQTEQKDQEAEAPQAQQLQDDPPFLQPQEQVGVGGSDPSSPSRSIYYPVPPADAFLGMDYFQPSNMHPYAQPYSGLYNYGYPYNYYPYSYANYGYPYAGYANLQNTLHPLMQQNRLHTGYSYPPIVINLPNRAGQN